MLFNLSGKIIDPHREFMIEENFKKDWDNKYKLIVKNIPNFLIKVSNKVLLAGKYLNAIQKFGKHIPKNDADTIQQDRSEDVFLQLIEEAYNFASSSLLNLILHENDLMGRLLSIKRYFLLQQGDFIAQFMDACENELKKNVEKVTPMKIEKLLELTLRLSSAKNDKYQDDLKIIFLPCSIQNQTLTFFTVTDEIILDFDELLELTGIESFTFGYTADWPVSIVLNQIAISKYQMLFRLLYYCKHVERQLYKLWIGNKNKSEVTKNKYMNRSAHSLCQKMMNAIQNIEYYMMVEVIEPNFDSFFNKLHHVKNIDEVLMCHDDFLQICLRDCMLTNSTLLNCIIQLCDICLEYSKFLVVEMKKTCNGNTDERVIIFSSKFTEKILELLNKLNAAYSNNHTEKFVSLIHRINFNLFYSENSLLRS